MIFFLVSDDLTTVVESSDILHGYRTDHSLIDIKLTFGDHKKGKGFWKFNNSLLKDRHLIEVIKKEIKNTKQQYADIPDPNSIDAVDDKDLNFTIDDKLFFETLLMNLRGTIISYASRRKKGMIDKEKEIEEKINELEMSNVCTNNVHNNLETLKEELEEIRKEK